MAIVDEKLFIRELDDDEKERNVNNFTHHPPTAEQGKRYETIRFLVRFATENIMRMCPKSRELSLAITHLEEAVFWANAAVARNEKSK